MYILADEILQIDGFVHHSHRIRTMSYFVYMKNLDRLFAPYLYSEGYRPANDRYIASSDQRSEQENLCVCFDASTLWAAQKSVHKLIIVQSHSFLQLVDFHAFTSIINERLVFLLTQPFGMYCLLSEVPLQQIFYGLAETGFRTYRLPRVQLYCVTNSSSMSAVPSSIEYFGLHTIPVEVSVSTKTQHFSSRMEISSVCPLAIFTSLVD